MKTAAPTAEFGEVDALQFFSHDFCFYDSGLIYMVTENRAFSQHVLL
jgi:hypothetical protein